MLGPKCRVIQIIKSDLLLYTSRRICPQKCHSPTPFLKDSNNGCNVLSLYQNSYTNKSLPRSLMGRPNSIMGLWFPRIRWALLEVKVTSYVEIPSVRGQVSAGF